MLSFVTISAEQLEIVKAQSDRRVRDVLRRDIDLVMNYLAGLYDAALQTSLAEMPAALCV